LNGEETQIERDGKRGRIKIDSTLISKF